jgi:Polyketide cyclase / dehydrase and lipid transport
MSAYRQQALIDVPLTTVWALVSDVERHPEWWPRVIKVQCEGIEQGCEYRQVTATLTGTIETDIRVEQLEDCRELNLRCLDTGTFCRWLLTETHDGTFIDAEFGMDPNGLANRVFDVVAGKRYFRRWLEGALDGLRVAAGEERTVS